MAKKVAPDAEDQMDEEAEIAQIMKTKGVNRAQAIKILASMPMSKEN